MIAYALNYVLVWIAGGAVRERGQDTDAAEDMLRALKGSLSAFKRHRELIPDRLKDEQGR